MDELFRFQFVSYNVCVYFCMVVWYYLVHKPRGDVDNDYFEIVLPVKQKKNYI